MFPLNEAGARILYGNSRVRCSLLGACEKPACCRRLFGMYDPHYTVDSYKVRGHIVKFYNPLSLRELCVNNIGAKLQDSCYMPLIPKSMQLELHAASARHDWIHSLKCEEKIANEALDDFICHNWHAQPYHLPSRSGSFLRDPESVEFVDLLNDRVSDFCWEHNFFIRVAYSKVDAEFPTAVNFPYYCFECAWKRGGNFWLTEQSYVVGLDDMLDELCGASNWCDDCAIRLFRYQSTDGFITPYGTSRRIVLTEDSVSTDGPSLDFSD